MSSVGSTLRARAAVLIPIWLMVVDVVFVLHLNPPTLSRRPLVPLATWILSFCAGAAPEIWRAAEEGWNIGDTVGAIIWSLLMVAPIAEFPRKLRPRKNEGPESA